MNMEGNKGLTDGKNKQETANQSDFWNSAYLPSYLLQFAEHYIGILTVPDVKQSFKRLTTRDALFFAITYKKLYIPGFSNKKKIILKSEKQFQLIFFRC